MKLKPISADVTLKYICPKCNNIFWLTGPESKWPGMKLCDECGEHIYLNPIEHIKVIFVNNRVPQQNQTPQPKQPQPPKQPKQQDQPSFKSTYIIEAIDILVSQGYTKGECIDIIKKQQIKDTSVEDVIKTILKYI